MGSFGHFWRKVIVCAGGSLKHRFFRKMKISNAVIPTEILVAPAVQMASGEQHVMHERIYYDLAARKILLMDDAAMLLLKRRVRLQVIQ